MAEKRSTVGLRAVTGEEAAVRPTRQEPSKDRHSRFNDFLLAVMTFLIVGFLGVAAGLYTLPPEHLEIPDLDPTVLVGSEADFPVGASRLIHWGERVILVVRRSQDQFHALQGVSPDEGCILEWDAQSLRVVSPCSYLVYDLGGRVVVGLGTKPLQRYSVLIRSGSIYVSDREL